MLFLLFCIFYIFTTIVGDRSNERVNGLSNLLLVACIIQAMGGVHTSALRVGYYYLLALPLLIPELVNNLHNTQNKIMANIINISIYFGFIIIGLYLIKNGSWAQCYPYHFFWEMN